MSSKLPFPPVPAEQIARQFEDELAGADALRAAALVSLRQLRSVRVSQLERSYERLANQADSDDPALEHLAARITAGRQLVATLAAEADRTSIATPEIDKRSWLLHGYLRSPDLQGQPDHVIALFDARGSWIESFGRACTDDQGYFRLQDVVDTETARLVTAKEELFLRVQAPDRQFVYFGKSPVKPRAGEVVYREIILESGKHCPAPTAAREETPATKEPPDRKSSTKKKRGT